MINSLSTKFSVARLKSGPDRIGSLVRAILLHEELRILIDLCEPLSAKILAST